MENKPVKSASQVESVILDIDNLLEILEDRISFVLADDFPDNDVESPCSLMGDLNKIHRKVAKLCDRVVN